MLSSIAQLHSMQGEHGRVVETMTRIWSLREPVLGKDHVNMIDTYLELARAFFNNEDDTNCQDNLERVLRIVSGSGEVMLVNHPSLSERLRPEREAYREGGISKDDLAFEFDDDELSSALPKSKQQRAVNNDDMPGLPPLKMSWKVADAMCLRAASLKRTGECKKATAQYEEAKEL